MRSLARWFVGLEAAGFAAAALMHAGVLARGYEHWKAATAESVIGGVLLAALIATFIVPASSRRVALAVQAFALLGTAVGLFTIVIGVGPRTTVDLIIHAAFVTTLVAGLIVVARRPVEAPVPQP